MRSPSPSTRLRGQPKSNRSGIAPKGIYFTTFAAVVLVTRPFSGRFADRIVGMSDGRIVFDGSPDGLANADLSAIYGGEDWMH